MKDNHEWRLFMIHLSQEPPISGVEKPAMTMTTNFVSSEEFWAEVKVVVSSLDSQYLPYLHF